MISFIEHNGGHVLAALAGPLQLRFPLYTLQLRQQPEWGVCKGGCAGRFANTAYEEGVIPYLGHVFEQACRNKKDGLPAEARLDLAERALNTRGYSLANLTLGECHGIKHYSNLKY